MASPPSSQQAQVSGIARILKRPDSNTAVLVQHFHLHLRRRAPIWPLAPAAALAGEQRTKLQHIPQHHISARSHPVQRRSPASQLDSQRSDRAPTSPLASLLQRTSTTSAQQQQRIFQRRVSTASAPRQHRISTASVQHQHRRVQIRPASLTQRILSSLPPAQHRLQQSAGGARSYRSTSCVASSQRPASRCALARHQCSVSATTAGERSKCRTLRYAAAASHILQQQRSNVSASSAHRQRIVSAASAQRQRSVSAASAQRQRSVSAGSAQRQRSVSAASAQRQRSVSAASAQRQRRVSAASAQRQHRNQNLARLSAS
jgi:hypothetical protein